jgi:hypothetical protein
MVVVALFCASLVAADQPTGPYAPWDGSNPFNCTIQNVGTGTDFTHPNADPFCVEFDKTHQNVTSLGILDFLSKEPARTAAAVNKCFYFQTDHWTGSMVQGGPELWHWDGQYFFDKAIGAGGVHIQNLRFLGQPASFPPGALPPQFQPYFDQGGGGAYIVGNIPADPSCAAKVDTPEERQQIYGDGTPPPTPPAPPTTTTPPPTTTTPPPTTTTPPPTTTTPPPTTTTPPPTTTTPPPTTTTPPPTTTTPPPTTPPPSNSCRTSDSNLSSNFLAAQAGSQPIWRDDCLSADPMPLYGAFCGARADGQRDMYTTKVGEIASGRLSLASSGGPANTPYRQLNIVPGDACWNNRDALGNNTNSSPVALWHEGQYRMLNTWVRLNAVNQASTWRELFEIKQAQPYPSGMSSDDGVMFEVQQRSGKLVFMSHWHDLWSVPITAGSWVPISVEGLWSADPAKGWLRFRAGSQVSGKFNGANLLRNTQNGSTVPSFLEMGPYQDSSLPGFSEAFAGLSVYG